MAEEQQGMFATLGLDKKVLVAMNRMFLDRGATEPGEQIIYAAMFISCVTDLTFRGDDDERVQMYDKVIALLKELRDAEVLGPAP